MKRQFHATANRKESEHGLKKLQSRAHGKALFPS